KTVLEYLKTGNGLLRQKVLQYFTKDYEISVDVLGQLIRLLPPVEPHQTLDQTIQKIEIDLPDGGATGDYYVRLPPEYNHQRSYPVLVLFHAVGEKPSDVIGLFSEQAAKHGYILVAPAWGKGFRPTYTYGAREHNIVLDSLRDLRRRF